MYTEEMKFANKYREDYLNSINELIADLQKKADVKRAVHFKEMQSNIEEYRREFVEMLGWPLTDYDEQMPAANKELLARDGEMDIYRIQFELPIGIKFYGLYFEHNNGGKLPFVIAQHGGQGTPEACSAFYEVGSGVYNGMIRRTFERGVNIFAPQLILWSIERYELDYDRKAIDAKLKQVGSSITAVEVYAIKKMIDYFSTYETIDANRIGMLGLSYGGFYTLFTAAADTRIKAALSSSQYNNRYEHAWSDWTWKSSAHKFLDNEVAMLVYPRYLSLNVGKEDETFIYTSAQAEYEKLKNMCKDHDWLDFAVFEAGHEFTPDDAVLDKFMEKLKNSL